MGNKPLLGFHQLIKIGVECTLGDIAENFYLRILVALPHDATKALLEVAGPPGTIEIMQGNKPVLDIGACAHFGRAAHEDAHLASTHFGKQLLFLLLGFGIMDKGNFLLRNTLCHELLFQVVIHIRKLIRYHFIDPFCIFLHFNRRILVRRRQVAENQLGAALIFGLRPDTGDIAGAGCDLAVGVIGGQRVDKAHIQRQLPSIVGDAEHIVRAGIDRTGTDTLGSFRQFRYHRPLQFVRLDDLGVKIGFRDRQVQHIRRLHIGHHFEGRHQLRQIEEFCKAGFRAIAAAFGGQFDGCHRLSKVAGPIVEVDKAHLLQRPILQVPLDRI